MDIVPLKSSHLQIKRAKRDASRRHTTEVSFEQLRGRALSELERDTITSLSTENLSGESYNDDNVHTDEGKLSSEQSSLNSSWNSLFNGRGGFDTPESDSSCYYVGSQDEVYKELNEVPKKSPLDVSTRHQYQLSYELALDNVLTPFIPHAPIISPLASSATMRSKSRSHSLNPRHVIDEVITTERSYIRDLTDVIDGYFVPFKRKLGVLPIQLKDIDDIFGNILEIRDFHQSFLGSLLESGHNPGKIATCFLHQAEGFKIYTQYCNNYPRSLSMLKEKSKDPDISSFLQGCQLRLHHMLPLDAFLLKPVQRVLKYSLLLYEMGKRTQKDSSSYEVVQNALQKMTDVAKHINAMKRKYDMAIHIQEIQSLIRGDWTGLDLTKFGDLVLEENLRYAHYSGRNARFRTERYVFLFQRLCLITKKEEDGYYYLKAHIEMADLQLTEKVEKLPRCFQLRQVSSGKYHTFMTTSQQVKDMWVRSIKLMLVESIPHLPDKTRELIMQGFDITPVQSPKRERHVRHFSEEPKRLHAVSYQPGEIRQDTLNKSQSMHMGPFSLQASGKALKPKLRSSTLPNTSRGSLMSIMASSVHSSQLMMEEDETINLQEGGMTTLTIGEKRNGALLKNYEDVTRHPQATGFKDAVNIDTGTQLANPELGIPQLSHSSTSSPHIGMSNVSDSENTPCLRRTEVQSTLDIYSHSEDNRDMYTHADMSTSSEVKGEHTYSRFDRVSLPNIVINGESHNQLPGKTSVTITPSTLYNNKPPPSVEIEIASKRIDSIMNLHRKGTFTSEEESFFDELMSSSSVNKYCHEDSDTCSGISVESTVEEVFNTPPRSVVTQDNTNGNRPTYNHIEGSDDNITPLASPCTSPSTLRSPSVKLQYTMPGNIDEDRLPTPIGSPYVNRPQSSSSSHQSHIDDVSLVIIDPPTPFRYLSPEPDVVQPSSNSTYTPHSTKPIVRRHSFSYNMKRKAIHCRQESCSTETTPQSTPIMKRSETAIKEHMRSSQSRYDDFTHKRDRVEVLHSQVNAGNTARREPSLKGVRANNGESLLEDEFSSNQIVLPPVEYVDNLSTCEASCVQHHDNPHINHQLHSSLDILPQVSNSDPNTKRSTTLVKDEITVTTPYESNPEEMMSFTEVLASFDDYATTTGKTTKSDKALIKLRSQSPEAKRRKQKKKKRSQTVANIDTDTMNQVKEELNRRSQWRQSISQQKSDSKVHQLAREYSRKIKDHQRSKMFKRFSTVVEEPIVPKTESAEPIWLQQLRERKKVSSMKEEATLPAITGPGANVVESEDHFSQFTSDKESGSLKLKTKPKVKDQSDLDEEQQRKSGFKGWVRSLVDKISTSGSAKDK